MKSHLRQIIFPIFLVVLLPAFATFVLCNTFQEGVIHSVPFGIIDQDNSELSRTLSRNLAENDTFDVMFYGDTADELEEQITQNNVIAGMIIPKDFSKNVSAGNSPSVLLIYDGCQMSAIGISKVKLTEAMTTLKVGASVQILEGKLNLQPQEALLYAQPISNTFRYLGNPEKSLRNYVVPGAVASIAQMTMYMFMIEATRKDDKQKLHPLLYCLFGSILATISLLICILIMCAQFRMPMRGAWSTLAILTFFNMMGIGNLAAIVRLLLPEKMKILAVQASVVVMAMLLFSGYTFPAIGMPTLFQYFAAVLPFTYFAIPLRDVMLLGSSTITVIGNIRWLFCFAACTAVPVAILWFFHRQKQIQQQYHAEQAAEVQARSPQEVSAEC